MDVDEISSYPEMVQCYLDVCKMKNNFSSMGTVDLSKETWFSTTKLLLLAEFIARNPAMTVTKPKNSNVARYVDIMTAGEPRGSCIPMVKMPTEQRKADEALRCLFDLARQKDLATGVEAFSYILGELVSNMYEHARFTNAFCMAQLYKKMKFVEVCFLDDGISIPGSFREYGLIYDNHTTALVEALNGQSTKQDKGRGCGLGTSVSLLLEGLKSRVLVISNKGCLYLEDGMVPRGYILSEPYTLNGTLVSARIPYPVPQVDIYEYVNK